MPLLWPQATGDVSNEVLIRLLLWGCHSEEDDVQLSDESDVLHIIRLASEHECTASLVDVSTTGPT